MLWAAYGDALGFPTELASLDMVRRRVGAQTVRVTTEWTRLVGGRQGATVVLPAGAYSDDTQLRIATSRAIRSGGFFDVEAFAKIELPVWLTYSLGGGRGSKAAAASLAAKSINWFSNFYGSNDPDLKYVEGGGNGAAMRIQPHVWAAADLENEHGFLVDVLKNSICTHGHMRGLAGAVIHAVCLARTLRTGEIPDPDRWVDYAQLITDIPGLISADPELATFWVPTWEDRAQTTLADAATRVADEWANSAAHTIQHLHLDPVHAYRTILSELGGLTSRERGSGLKCALFALAACWIFRKQSADQTLQNVVNVLDSDTDTIGTMAGALRGAVRGEAKPVGKIQDRDYLEAEAERLYRTSQGRSVADFDYPDLLYWQPPKSALDGVYQEQGNIKLAGLGPLLPRSEEFPSAQKGTLWQWFMLPFGQTVLCKRRLKLGSAEARSGRIRDASSGGWTSDSKQGPRADERNTPVGDLFAQGTDADDRGHLRQPHSIHRLTDEAIQSGFDPSVVGKHLLTLSEGEDGIERAVAYAAVIAKAKMARTRRKFKNGTDG